MRKWTHYPNYYPTTN